MASGVARLPHGVASALGVPLPRRHVGARARLGAPVSRRRKRLPARLTLDGLAESLGGDQYRLTPAGWQRALRVTRGYRLWETFLREYPDLAHGYANLDAESIDHVLPAPIVASLEAELKRSGRWPQLPPEIAGAAP